MGFDSAKKVTDSLLHAYYNERNVENVLSCVTDDISWMSAGSNDKAEGKNELRELLMEDMIAFPNPLAFEIEEEKNNRYYLM